MATFRVGQRVRIIGGCQRAWIGKEVEIIGALGSLRDHNLDAAYEITPPIPEHANVRCGAHPDHIAPLTDPKADEFIERIKKLKPYEEPVVQKVSA